MEFTDGSTWGLDASGSAQMLAGFRAGALAAFEYLKTIKKNTGTESIINSLDELSNITPPKEQRDKWKSHFKTGTRFVGRKIKEAYEKEGVKAVEDELENNIFSQPDK